jgi:hypothetical protein
MVGHDQSSQLVARPADCSALPMAAIVEGGSSSARSRCGVVAFEATALRTEATSARSLAPGSGRTEYCARSTAEAILASASREAGLSRA